MTASTNSSNNKDDVCKEASTTFTFSNTFAHINEDPPSQEGFLSPLPASHQNSAHQRPSSTCSSQKPARNSITSSTSSLTCSSCNTFHTAAGGDHRDSRLSASALSFGRNSGFCSNLPGRDSFVVQTGRDSVTSATSVAQGTPILAKNLASTPQHNRTRGNTSGEGTPGAPGTVLRMTSLPPQPPVAQAQTGGGGASMQPQQQQVYQVPQQQVTQPHQVTQQQPQQQQNGAGLVAQQQAPQHIAAQGPPIMQQQQQQQIPQVPQQATQQQYATQSQMVAQKQAFASQQGFLVDTNAAGAVNVVQQGSGTPASRSDTERDAATPAAQPIVSTQQQPSGGSQQPQFVAPAQTAAVAAVPAVTNHQLSHQQSGNLFGQQGTASSANLLAVEQQQQAQQNSTAGHQPQLAQQVVNTQQQHQQQHSSLTHHQAQAGGATTVVQQHQGAAQQVMQQAPSGIQLQAGMNGPTTTSVPLVPSAQQLQHTNTTTTTSLSRTSSTTPSSSKAAQQQGGTPQMIAHGNAFQSHHPGYTQAAPVRATPLPGIVPANLVQQNMGGVGGVVANTVVVAGTTVQATSSTANIVGTGGSQPQLATVGSNGQLSQMAQANPQQQTMNMNVAAGLQVQHAPQYNNSSYTPPQAGSMAVPYNMIGQQQQQQQAVASSLNSQQSLFRRFAIEHNTRRRLFRCSMQDTPEDILDTVKQAFGLFHVLGPRARIRFILPQSRETLCSLRVEGLQDNETYQLLIFDPDGQLNRGVSNLHERRAAERPFVAPSRVPSEADVKREPSEHPMKQGESQQIGMKQEAERGEQTRAKYARAGKNKTPEQFTENLGGDVTDGQGTKSATELDDSEDAEVERSPDGRYIRYKGEPRGGAGAFNRVNLGYDSNTGRQIAWNVLDKVPAEKESRELATDPRRESEWIVRGLSAWEGAGSSFVVITSRGSSHTIRSHISRLPKDRPLKLAVVRKWARDLAEGLQFFASLYKKQPHGAVNIDNVFVKQNTGNLFLGDPSFGKTPTTLAEKVLAKTSAERRDLVGYGLCLLDIVYKGSLASLDKAEQREFRSAIEKEEAPAEVARILHETLRTLLKLCFRGPKEGTTASAAMQEIFGDGTTGESTFLSEADENDVYCELAPIASLNTGGGKDDVGTIGNKTGGEGGGGGTANGG
ncbi:unnamed protein product [Amoebophrya sp. A25]|nr:unnamed protein product [Amoebophrya sp. A25]|eukprot:GSA25T00021917001.1